MVRVFAWDLKRDCVIYTNFSEFDSISLSGTRKVKFDFSLIAWSFVRQETIC